MAAIRISVSLEPDVLDILRGRASRLRMPASTYLASLVRADAARERDELAAEGYRMLSADTGTFAEAAAPIAAETWPTWSRGHGPTADE